MSDKEKKKWTADQQNAIDAEGGPLLVTAAAGSGKTAVLTERILRLITEEGIDADRLLVLTFTRAAAAEMRNRIAAKLNERLAEDPGNRVLLRQQMLLTRANISTVDSFCADLVRENFRLLGVENDFRLIEEQDYTLFCDEVLSDLLESKYETREKGFLMLCELLSEERSNNDFRKRIQKLYSFLCSYDDREKWLSELEENANNFDSDANVWKQLKLMHLKEEAEYHLARMTLYKGRMPDDLPYMKKNHDILADEIAILSALREASDKGEWNNARGLVQSAVFSTWGKNTEKDPDVDNAKNVRDGSKKFIKGIADFFSTYDDERIRRDNEEIKPMIFALTSLLRDYTAALDQAKREANVLAFEDLELLTLRLLTERDEKENYIRSRYAGEIADRFDAVFVDEYQDTNHLQALLYDILSKDGKNLFMVGDIKQSIYAFRSATPEIFEKKKEQYRLYNKEDPSFPSRIALSANFRSREGVTDFVNFVFRMFCTPTLGGTVYDENEELAAKGKFTEKDKAVPDTELLYFEGGNAPENIDRTVLRIVERIRGLMKEKITVDEKNPRPLRYGDIAILCRSPKKAVRQLTEAFRKAGIPLSVENAENNFFEKREIRIALALLRAVNNPYDDVSYAAALLSPVFGYTPDDLALVRTEYRSVPLCEAVEAFSNTDRRFDRFLHIIEELRYDADEYPVDVFLLKFFDRMSLIEILSACGGETAAADLDVLVGYTADFAGKGNRSLASFLRYIDRLQENGIDLPTANVSAPDAVRLMSIHKSKGLEFPVVILPKFSSFNMTDIQNSSDRVHPKYGFASKIKRDGVCYKTLPLEVMTEVAKRELRSEELRVLYVAMTRAVDRLIVIDVRKDIPKEVDKAAEAAGNPTILRYLASKANDAHQWLLWAACFHRDGAWLCETAGVPPLFDVKQETKPIKVVCKSGEEEEQTEIPAEEAVCPDEDAPAFDTSVFNVPYPFENDRKLPTKISASSISHDSYQRKAVHIRPSFLEREGKLSAAEKGTATHLFMSLIDYSSEQTLSEQRDAFVREGKLTGEQANTIELSACEAFLSSKLGKRVLAAARRGDILREYAFSFRKRASTLGYASETDEFVMISGVADLIFFEDGKTVIVDYKTDKVTAEELKERYAPQLALYHDAARTLWQGRDVERVLWSFALGMEIPV